MTLSFFGEIGFDYCMNAHPEKQTISRSFASVREPLPLTLSALRRRLKLLQKLIPAALLLLVIIYEVGPSRWIHDRLSADYHFITEILIYGTIGPLLAFVVLEFLARWLEERETSELQAQVLELAREHARINHKLSDDALQALFAASALIVSLESRLPDNSPEVAAQLHDAQKALDQIIQELRAHLLVGPPPEKQR